MTFLVDITRQTVRNLWHDGSLFRWSTWRSGYQLLLSPTGMYRSNYANWKAYRAPDFHPRQQDDSLSKAWLQANADQFTALARPA
jgi:predicted metal-dependent hydrolase